MRRIKRTKITVIRTETVFLKMQTGDAAKEFLKVHSADPTEQGIKDAALEIEAVERTEDTEKEK